MGEYVVCPEAWRLKMLKRVKSPEREDARRGNELHEEWAHGYDESAWLARATKIAATLIVIAVVFFLWMKL